MAISAICFFPLDVANAGASVDCGIVDGACGGFNFTMIWYILFILIVVLLVLVLPFTVFFYETMDIDQPPVCKRMQTACGYALGTVVIVGAVTAIFCMIINRTDIDITAFEITPDNTFYVGDGDSATFIRLRFVSI